MRRCVQTAASRSALALCVGMLGCGDSGDADATTADGGVDAAVEIQAPGTLFGGFDVQLVEAVADPDDPGGENPAHTSVIGRLDDGPQPVINRMVLAEQDGDCGLWVQDPAGCSPECEGTDVCTDDDVCTPFPSQQDVGDVRTHGLTDEVITLSRGPTGEYQAIPTLPSPPCESGAEVAIESRAFRLENRCIDALELLNDAPIRVRDGEPVELAWVPGNPSLDTHIVVTLDIGHHGGGTTELRCDLDDTGTGSIPESLVSNLWSMGVAGLPGVILERRLSTTHPDHPALSLNMVSPVERIVDTGFTSCASDADCEPGLHCDPTSILCM